MLSRHEADKKIAIIQNEFAPANIDGEELKRKGRKFEILEINNGSVFCVCLLSNFISSLLDFIKQHNPDVIFLEASGLSDPIAIAQLLDFEDLRTEVYLAKIFTIIDASSFLKQHQLLTRLQHQVRVADDLILNKTDLASKEQLSNIKKTLGSLNPFAQMLESSYCILEEEAYTIDVIQEVVASKTKDQHDQFESCGRPDIGVGVLRSSRSISKDKLEQFIDIYSKKTIRIKGFAKLKNGEGLAVQTSYENKAFELINNYQGSTELIAMGEQFNLSEFSRNYRMLTK